MDRSGSKTASSSGSSVIRCVLYIGFQAILLRTMLMNVSSSSIGNLGSALRRTRGQDDREGNGPGAGGLSRGEIRATSKHAGGG